MDFFENSYRTISTRGIILTKEQMANYRIKRIYNSAGNPEFLNASHAEEMMDNFIRRGEFCLVETSEEEKIYRISLITFEDIWSRNMFALVHFNYYEGYPDLITLYN